MLVLKILGVILIIAAVVFGLRFFNDHCDEKFSYRFFTASSFWATAGSLGLLLLGYWWRSKALESGGDALNGIVVMALGAIVAAGLVYFNFKKTNFVYGVGGSVLQISVFSILAYIGVFVAIVGLVLMFVSEAGVQRVRVINK